MKNTFDYLYIYFSENYLTHERTKKECTLIEHLCSLKKVTTYWISAAAMVEFPMSLLTGAIV